jgi:glycosyltransferase involved in cell wall biosynthesis
VHVHEAWRPFNRHLLGGPLLARTGRRIWRQLAGAGVHAVVNGGNCRLAAANWVHYVHGAFPPRAGDSLTRAKTALTYGRDVAAERAALREAAVVICNSERTRNDLVEHAGVAPARVRVIYYGTDPQRFAPVTPGERAARRRAFGWPADRPLVGFVGALGDRRKAFDTLFSAWASLCARPEWDADLVVAGRGAELAAWTAHASAAGLGDRIRFLGFRSDIPDILASLDLLVHPARYEAYGLSVHEAVCRGIPAIVTASAGVAERYPAPLRELLLENADCPSELDERLQLWRRSLERLRDLTAPFSAALRARTWDMMSAEVADAVERAA